VVDNGHNDDIIFISLILCNILLLSTSKYKQV